MSRCEKPCCRLKRGAGSSGPNFTSTDTGGPSTAYAPPPAPAAVAAGGGGLLLLLLLLPLAVAATEGLDGLDHAAPADDAPGAMPPPGMWFPWSSRERK